MDSLARLTHSHMPHHYGDGFENPVATAVGFVQAHQQTALAVAHNTSGPQQQQANADRLAWVQASLKGHVSPVQAAQQLEDTSGLRPRTAERRLEKDLSKLRKTYEGHDSGRPGAQQLQSQLHAVFDQAVVPWYDFTTLPASGVVHAESALLGANVPGHIGVSKLSCGDCADYADEQQRANDVRGTHGQRFPGWTHPGDGSVSRDRAISNENQYPSDSDSD